ncbi:hypothetical protein [Campylobacter sp. RM16189]|uniref:hypothetical protein n=1 Tax=Campylobacter sp. RM16189 TaxID=1705726 RepID=UPI001474B8C8|nr:hypothetical protein [Campylobacter sp. RM16189]
MKKYIKRVNLTMEPLIWQKFCEISAENRSDPTKELRKLIDRYIEHYEKKREEKKK